VPHGRGRRERGRTARPSLNRDGKFRERGFGAPVR
jgi:hypothetical protein